MATSSGGKSWQDKVQERRQAERAPEKAADREAQKNVDDAKKN